MYSYGTTKAMRGLSTAVAIAELNKAVRPFIESSESLPGTLIGKIKLQISLWLW